MDGWMDGLMDRIMDTDGIMGGQTNEWINMQFICTEMHKTMIFQ